MSRLPVRATVAQHRVLEHLGTQQLGKMLVEFLGAGTAEQARMAAEIVQQGLLIVDVVRRALVERILQLIGGGCAGVVVVVGVA